MEYYVSNLGAYDLSPGAYWLPEIWGNTLSVIHNHNMGAITKSIIDEECPEYATDKPWFVIDIEPTKYRK